MGKRQFQILDFIKHDFRVLFSTAKFYVVVAVLVVGMLTCFGGVREYLQYTYSNVNPLEVYLMSVTNRVSLWIIYTGSIVLTCDVPFRHKGDIIRIVRSSKKKWLIGQILFSYICILIYHVILVCFFFLLTFGHWDLSPSWSPTIQNLEVNGGNLGIVFGIRFPFKLLDGRIIPSVATSMILQFLMGCASSSILAMFYIKGTPKTGLFLCALFPLIDYILLDAFDYPWCKLLSHLISPFSMSSTGRLYPVASYGISVSYAILYLSCISIWCFTWMYMNVKSFDFYLNEQG